MASDIKSGKWAAREAQKAEEGSASLSKAWDKIKASEEARMQKVRQATQKEYDAWKAEKAAKAGAIPRTTRKIPKGRGPREGALP